MRALSRLRNWLSSWDAASRVAAALCVLPFLIPILTSEATAKLPVSTLSVPLWETLLGFFLYPLAIIASLPMIACPQFFSFLFVRRTHYLPCQVFQLLVSLFMLLAYYKFMQTADLASTSTASLAAMFYPIFLAFFAVPLAFAAYRVSKVFRDEA